MRLVPHAKSKPEYAHVGQLERVTSDAHQASEALEERRNDVQPIPCVDGIQESKNSNEVVPQDNRERKPDSSRSKGHRHRELADPEAFESVKRSLSQQQRSSLVGTSPKQPDFPLEPISSSPPSRTSSQRKSLERFARQLEKYYQATGGECNLPISTPTLTESRASVHTVTELLPYHSEFQAAGLAVTSKEQTPEKEKKTKRVKQLTGDEHKPGVLPLSNRLSLETKEAVSRNEAFGDLRAVPTRAAKETAGKTCANIKSQDVSLIEKKMAKNRLPWSRKQNQPLPPIPPDEEDKSDAQAYARLRSTKAPAPPSPTRYWDVLGEFVASPPLKESTQAISARVDGEPPPFRSSTDKPLPKPPVFHRPLPQRSGRRHMENTSQWPTAGVLIHDHTPIIPETSSQAATEPTPAVSKSQTSGRIRLLPMSVDGSSSFSSRRANAAVLKPRGKGVFRSRAKENELPSLPSTIHEETVSSIQSGKPGKSFSRPQQQCQAIPPPPLKDRAISKPDMASSDNKPFQDSAPKLPCTWESTVESSSSFEKALDGIIEMLNDMDHRRQQERLINFEAARGLSARMHTSPKKQSYGTKSNDCDPATSRLSFTPSPTGSKPPLENKSTGHGDMSSDDRNIDDKDVLHSLRMVVCAACNEELDAWIRSKTGLRLRRFLADLKTFEDLRENEEQTKSIKTKPRPRNTSSARTNGQRKRRSRVEKRQSRNETSTQAAASGRAQAKKTSGNICFGGNGNTGSQ